MVFAIVALFAATQVLAEPKVTQKGSYFIFESGAKITPRTVYYEMNRTGDEIQELRVNGAVWSLVDNPGIRHFTDFRFCVQDDEGNIEIDNKQFKCYEPKWVTNEAGFISNPSCPWFLDPPGIFIDPCK